MKDSLTERMHRDYPDVPKFTAHTTSESKAEAEFIYLMEVVESLYEHKNNAYSERNQLLCAFVKLAMSMGWQCGLGKHEVVIDQTIGDNATITPWDPEWLNVVYIDSPMGQMSWHIHDSELTWFSFLSKYEKTWDGHSTTEKYERLAKIQILSYRGHVVTNSQNERVFICDWCGSREHTWRGCGKHGPQELRNILDTQDSPLTLSVLCQNLMNERDPDRPRRIEQIYADKKKEKNIQQWTMLQMRMPGFMSLGDWWDLDSSTRQTILDTVERSTTSQDSWK